MKISNISGIHKSIKITAPGSDYLLVPHTASSCITTIQSMILKAPKATETEFKIKTQRLGESENIIMEVKVPSGSSKIINVKQQLPEAVGMYVMASVAESTVTVNGITVKLEVTA